MIRLAVCALPALLVACPKTGATGSGTDAMSAEMRKWAAPPETFEYLRVNRAGPLPLPDVQSRDEWVGPELEDGRLVYTVTTFDDREAVPEEVYKYKVFYGPEGFGNLGSWEDGEYTAWVPPQVVLPPEPAVGQTWHAVHQKGKATSDRECEIMESDLCEGGIVSVCDSKREGGRIIMRDHFCPDMGWVGFEAMALAGDNPPVRMWSEQMTRNGVRLGVDDTTEEAPEPEPEMAPEEAPAPAPEPVETPAPEPEGTPAPPE